MNLFPGRTLEELDQIDLNRLLRVHQARRMEAVEGRRRAQMTGKLKSEEIAPDEWQMIVEMDRIARTLD